MSESLVYYHCHYTQTAKTTQYTGPHLTTDISNEYTITLRNKFDALQGISETLLQMRNIRASSTHTW